VEKVVQFKQLTRSSLAVFQQITEILGFSQLVHAILRVSLSGSILEIKIKVEFLTTKISREKIK
jgi:hypothetical protein